MKKIKSFILCGLFLTATFNLDASAKSSEEINIQRDCAYATFMYLEAFEEVNGCMSADDYNTMYTVLKAFCEMYSE